MGQFGVGAVWLGFGVTKKEMLKQVQHDNLVSVRHDNLVLGWYDIGEKTDGMYGAGRLGKISDPFPAGPRVSGGGLSFVRGCLLQR